MAAQRIALLAGATGLIGGHLLRQLLDGGGYDRVISLGRRTLPDTHPRLEQRVVDFGALSAEAFEGVTDVFCALGTTMKQAGSEAAFRKVDHDAPLALAELSSKAGAQQFLLVSSVGADAGSVTFYLRVKGEVERDVAAVPFASVHIFQPSMLLGERGTHRPAEAIGGAVMRGVQGIMLGPLKRYRPIEASSVAAAMSEAARRGKPGRHVYQYEEIVAFAAAPRN
ncbi:oxidoreductase [Chondromyces crocatus]|uniref:Oxidoreductase n=1 Tax=Chondromyces crocatus TaxID=52 RepID=A0A0K1EB90_CHOCO|nr:oxidoreductase [Chondromyces crocatus]AKT38125.1 oxidoreductase [Chondromyces crocatus]